MQQDGDALRRVGVLVQIDRDAGHAGYGEVERRRSIGRVPEDPSADAGVDVAADAGSGCDRRDLADRVNDAVGVGGCRGDDQHCVRIDRGGHAGRVGAGGRRIDLDEDRTDPEVVRRLVEGGVRAGRQHHGRMVDLWMRIAGGLDGQQHRLGAAGGHRPNRSGRRVQDLGAASDDFALHQQQTGKGRGVQAV